MRRRVLVTGRVQGVFFRDSTRNEASRLDVTGWVRNLPDGSVEAELEGLPDSVTALTEWMRHGPEQARVDHLTSTDLPGTGETGFEVR